MGGGSGIDEPLKPIYNHQKAPWVKYHKKYTGQKTWWAEPSYQDPVVNKSWNRLRMPRYKEEDPFWFDPPVKDGTSLAGPTGNDTKYDRNVNHKGDTPMNIRDWQEKLYKGSLQYKEIAKKWNISPEHPGIEINPGYEANTINKSPWAYGYWSRVAWKGGIWGPRFFDKPLNESCVVKGLAVSKWLAMLMIPVTATDGIAYRRIDPGQGLGAFGKRYLRNCVMPCTAGFAWGVALCTASNVRNKDDIYNHFFSSFVVGAVVTTAKDNFPKGFMAFAWTLLLGCGWHYCRVSEAGLQGQRMTQQTSGNFGPTAYQFLQLGEVDKPEKDW